jgi:hypothetical protein
MNWTSWEPADPDDTETRFRRAMGNATDRAWDLRVDQEALAAMYDVLKLGLRRQRGWSCRP